ncbi:hypothetical protein KXW75_004193 [Aspergillus fumigatus]|nr:hypothetical protein KXX45_004707 [Aspergillus fumigatus]KAH1857085.1 hypothetical protein KXX54_003045 [Aspergillus fumigatus]KAH1957951.1 hypothetical protein KXV59_008575 [Aspergillus fumigatus]KAH1962746.1 hypothetical protein KXV90_003637 [Aspergillus fumigatus]KAH2117547.1 hypothetical protein KXW75_004193 [Aspergillus fumigatus]
MTSLASAFVPNSGRPERHLQAEPMSATAPLFVSEELSPWDARSSSSRLKLEAKRGATGG